MRISIATPQRRDAVSEEVPWRVRVRPSVILEPLSVAKSTRPQRTLPDLADLRQKARSQDFSAAWGDEWNPNPLGDLSS